MMLAEGQLVQCEKAGLMANVKGRESALCSKITVLLNDDRRGATNRAGVIERFRKSVEGLHGNALRESVNQAHLKRIVN